MERALAYFWCSHLQMISPRKIRAVLEFTESPEEIFLMKEGQLREGFSFTVRECDIFRRTAAMREDVEACYRRLADKGIRYVTIESSEYPDKLREVEDRPVGLFVRGRLPDGDRPCVAIVGARACSAYGRHCAEYTADVLAREGVQVISGMAYGIDCSSQKAALGVGESFAVLGGGVDICYPRENYGLYEELFRKGGVVSELLPGTKGIPVLFPRRNRIISGMSDAVVVIEAREKSGSLITADFAAEQGRNVYAVPGPVDSPLSRGCHELIRNGAILLQDPQELLEDLHIFRQHEGTEDGRRTVGKRGLDHEEQDVYSFISAEPVSMERLLQDTGYPVGNLSGVLLHLELKGYISRLPGNQYQKTCLLPPGYEGAGKKNTKKTCISEKIRV